MTWTNINHVEKSLREDTLPEKECFLLFFDILSTDRNRFACIRPPTGQ